MIITSGKIGKRLGTNGDEERYAWQAAPGQGSVPVRFRSMVLPGGLAADGLDFLRSAW
jgi:hypothetical protein